MSSNVIQGAPNPFPIEPTDEAPRPASRVALHPAWRLLKPLASLRLTVVLFVLSLILVFFGTLAQINNGIWTIVEQYFRSFWVWIDYQLAVQFAQIFFGVDKSVTIPGAFPFPGGWTIGAVLLVNLLTAHLVRFKLSWKRSGIILIHGGLILMMIGELVTGLYAVEGNMVIEKGQTTNYLVHGRYSELVVIDHGPGDEDRVVVVPDALLQIGGLIQSDKLPFDVRVDKYMKNSGIPENAPPNVENLATDGLGLKQTVLERPEVGGADPDQKYDYPSAFVTLLEKGTDKSLGTYLVSILFSGEVGDKGLQPVTVDGKTYDVGLRFKRTYKDYAIQLLDFSHKKYRGTNIAKDFRSTVRLMDSVHGDDRNGIEIYMNHPLRYRGETFYQSGVLPRDSGTILQVVRNPGWLLPYFSCFFVTLGMIVHFSMTLNTFLKRTGGNDAELKARAERVRKLLHPFKGATS